MPLDDILKRIDEQIAQKRILESKPPGDRRQPQERRTTQQPVAEDRRAAERRTTKDRRGTPRREDFQSNEAYNKAYDRWAENQR